MIKIIAALLGVSAAALLTKSVLDTVATETPDNSAGNAPATNLITETVSNMTENTKNLAADVAAVFGTKYDDLILSAALQYGVDPATLYRLLQAESHFRPEIINGTLRSRTGALGIAQFMPATALQELGSVDAALDPARAIPGAARYLAKLIKSTGSVTGGVAAYNWGVGNVQRKGVDAAPAETIKYVMDITGEVIG